jgi:threonine synthase
MGRKVNFVVDGIFGNILAVYYAMSLVLPSARMTALPTGTIIIRISSRTGEYDARRRSLHAFPVDGYPDFLQTGAALLNFRPRQRTGFADDADLASDRS